MRLFVLSPNSSTNGPQLHVGGSGWALLEQDLELAGNGVDFTCVSYSWGSGKTRSAFNPVVSVSDRTEPSISTVIRQRPACRRIWVDAFCVPSPEHPVEREATLQSMGFIYSRAEEVIVVLTAQARPALERISSESSLLRAHLDILEQEDWVTRAWTYQEAVNSKRLLISCHEAPVGIIIEGLTFVSYVGEALNELSPQERAGYPRLSSFEDVMLDYVMAGYLQRSALQVMTIMDGRTQTWPDDHFYAMIGAISTEPAGTAALLSPCEAFMSLCEREGDFSFIFSSTLRGSRPGRRWRPDDGADLPAILKLSGTGRGLQGRLENGSLLLEDVAVLKPAPLSQNARALIERWPADFKVNGYDADLELEQMAFRGLQELGFCGSLECVATDAGLFFPQVRIPAGSLAGVEIIVAVGIPWRLGSPALARYWEGSDETAYYVPGVLFGRVVATEHPAMTVTLD